MRSLGPYDGWIRDSVLNLKFNGEFSRDRMLGELLAGQLVDLNLPSGTLIVAVPLHPKRLNERGYNQADKIARVVAPTIGCAIETPLVRIKETKQQAKLDAADRMLNMADAFAVTADWAHRLNGRTIVIVDDVTTTGSTIGACATPLLRAGAIRAVGLTIARSL